MLAYQREAILDMAEEYMVLMYLQPNGLTFIPDTPANRTRLDWWGQNNLRGIYKIYGVRGSRRADVRKWLTDDVRDEIDKADAVIIYTPEGEVMPLERRKQERTEAA